MKKRELMGLFKFLELQGYETDSLSKFIFNLKHENEDLKTQQQEFIKYMKNIIEELECEDVDDEEMRGYLFQRADTFKEILKKYLEIIGVNKDGIY